MLRDIRELADEPDAYAAELRRRWGGLLSYRYIPRSCASLDVGPADDTERAAALAGTDRLPGVSSHVVFAARGKAGPFRIEAEPIAGAYQFRAVERQ